MENLKDKRDKKSDSKWEVGGDAGHEGNSLKIVFKNLSQETDKQQTALPKRPKRKASETANVCAVKRAKMDKEEVQQLIRDTIGIAREQIKSDLQEVVGPIKAKLDSLDEKTENLSKECETNSRQITSLTSNISSLKEDIKNELKTELKSELDASNQAAHKYSLSKEIEKSSGNLIIHGLQDPSEGKVRELISNMNIDSPNPIEIKRVQVVGKEGKKSCLVTLGDQNQRNAVLGKAAPKNLPAKVRMDKDVPRQYRNEYKKMQEEAFKHKCFFNVQCHVTFIGHEMVLRYREKDNKDKGFTILRTWFPPSQIKSVSGKGNTSSGGPIPSNKIDDDALLQAS